ncbi:hypothetical protein CLAFUW4_03992 [Fulvia fulva]|uniref:Ubiquitin-like protease family profile domain-containing protein n=1 Tax=Passalora fulva TaxID=5499 RepID=A0A9Q8LEY1_PASFU|nr:uncharacterized protein CLAFUR5_03957 [Fulvia fulva]KAK4627041.1 hypothetical protein CLAFUR4_03978 [Fulvia fulva]KAK4627985.1 hypothetical protein CLAFUR0_03979 [Fulvia fulva]UJO16311.1 hypothetical protein CLAFUR5_03957 [Fulvia fulva]WPV13694.1 hypothetical protein CLAFUW4_03992 [Fulvia fulva]WPV28040.1 hypothetical protein CLAFUW7_03981 [Fulvia fulva]
MQHMDGTTYKGSESVLTLSNLESDHLLPDDDMDGEDDFFVEAARQALEKGRLTFNGNDYEGAAAYLREALTMTKDLTEKQQALCNTWDLRRMLGVCAFHTDDPAEAEAALLSVLGNAPKNAILDDDRRLQISEIAHFLGQTYIRLGDLDKAYRYGEYALRGRRRVLGKSHEQSYESLALMARMLELQGNNIRAEFFEGMIPEEERKNYLPRFERLSPAQISRADSKLGNHSPVTPLEKSLDSALEAVSFSTPELSRQEHARSSSALSGSISAAASDAGERGTWRCVSPDADAGSFKASRSVPVLVTKVSGEIARGHPNRHYQVFPNASQSAARGRPLQLRSFSDRAIYSSIPVLTSPATPQAYLGVDPHQGPVTFQEGQGARHISGRADLPSAHAHQAHTSSVPAAPGLYPQPLRLRRTAFVHELPGDRHFSVAPGSPHTVPLPCSPVRHTPSVSPGQVKLAAISQDQAYAHLMPQHPSDRRSTSEYTRSTYSHGHSIDVRSSEYSRSSCSRSQSMDILPDTIQPESIMERKPTERPKTRKTSSLFKMFRTKSATTESSSSSIKSSTLAMREYTVRLSYHDMSTIKSEAITENVIEFWQEHLEYDLIQGNTKYVLMRPVRCYFLINDSEITPAMKATLPDFQSTIHVLIPLRSHAGHWSFLLISSQDQLACHYDPHTNRNHALAERVTKRISSFLDKPLKFLDVPDTPQQPHDKDSGIFVCLFMQQLITKLQSTHESQKVEAGLMGKAVEVKAARKGIYKIAKAANPPIAGLGE